MTAASRPCPIPPVAQVSETERWQPIETAPRDGEAFWGLIGKDAISMFWHEGFGEFVSAFRRMTLVAGMTFSETGLDYSDHSPTIHKPQWWMPPIPAPTTTTPRRDREV